MDGVEWGGGGTGQGPGREGVCKCCIAIAAMNGSDGKGEEPLTEHIAAPDILTVPPSGTVLAQYKYILLVGWSGRSAQIPRDVQSLPEEFHLSYRNTFGFSKELSDAPFVEL